MFTIFANCENKVYLTGKCGHDFKNFTLLTHFPSINPIKIISRGNGHCFIYLTNGELWGFGYNNEGQINIHNKDYHYEPILILTNPSIKIICCGIHYTIIYNTNGELWKFGNNENKSLLMTDPTIKLISSDGYNTFIYKDDGTLVNINNNIIIFRDTSIKSITCGIEFLIIYKYDGSLLGYGHNETGQLGIDNKINHNSPSLILKDINIKLIACGGYHTLIYKNNGDLYGFGSNHSGQLGLNVNIKFKSVPTLILNDKTIVSIACGIYHSIIYKNNGQLYVCGYNLYNRIGLDSNIKSIYEFTLVWSDPSIKFLMNHKTNIEWDPENHKNCPNETKNRIFSFLLCNYIKYSGCLYKIPKFILFEIFRYIF